ncbi:hypothetical protein RvY_17641 [Ramazzottius varieornatus]|uniref:Histone-lysine N-methyltransferase n=1 Tax=Ramazzottius varieornatus TaxID=947166 RepID=A0A1D1W2V6_RAMVA|nr:hypothetical protein RvY_17641 [Ramazzottius varieornatus]
MEAKRKAKAGWKDAASRDGSQEVTEPRSKRTKKPTMDSDDEEDYKHRSQFPSVDHLEVTHCNLFDSYPVYGPVSLGSHDCSPAVCRPSGEGDAALRMYARVVHSPLVLPLLFGWERKRSESKAARRVTYVTPCGRTLSSLEQVDDFLLHIESILPIQCFSFEVGLDISSKIYIPRHTVKSATTLTLKNAQFEVAAFNCYVKDNPAKFTYVNKVIMTESANERLTKGSSKKRTEWCHCSSPCSTSSSSSCLCQHLNDEDEAEEGFQHGLLLKFQKCVSECSSSCKCPPTCRNRVSSSTVPWRVLLYYFPGKGYGVRAVCDIPKGAFIGMYTGQLLTERDVGRTGRPDTYYFTLTNLNEGNSQDQMKNGTLDYKDLFTLDAQYFGNFTRFLNHSCDPNLFPQPMLRDYTGPLVYHIGFFTSRLIKAGEEMTWNYNYEVGTAKYKIDCRCGAENCRKRLL